MRNRWVLLAGAIIALALFAAVPLVGANEPTATTAAITSADSYTSVEVTFSRNAYTSSTDGAGSGPLVASDFQVRGVGGVTPPAIGGVERASTGSDFTRWRITFSAAVEPHTVEVSVRENQVFASDGSVFPVAWSAAPFSPADLTALLGGIKGLPAVPGRASLPEGAPDPLDLPFVRDWFAQAKDLTALIPNLGTLTAANRTEAQVVTALKGLANNAIKDITFSGRQVNIEFDDTKTSFSTTMRGTAGVESIGNLPYELSLAGDANVGVKLGGTVALRVDRASNVSTAKFVSAAAQVSLAGTATFTPTGRLGVVNVSAPDTALRLGATLTLAHACTEGVTAPCALADLATPVVTVAGTAELDLKQVNVAIGGTTHQFKESDSSVLLALRWPNLSTPGTVQLRDGIDKLGALKLRDFTNVSVGDIAGGLQWIGTWLTEIEKYGQMGAELPVIGGTAGELSELSGTLARPATAIGELLGLLGELTAQDLLDLCDPVTIETRVGARIDALGLSLADLTALLPPPSSGDWTVATATAELKRLAKAAATVCQPLLSNVAYDATGNAITYTISFTVNPQLGQLVNSSLDLGFAELSAAGLEDMSVAVRGGSWGTSTASMTFNLTFGVKLGSAESLGVATGVATNDFDGDGQLDSVDTDVDGDGIPERHTFVEGDRCRGMAALFGLSVQDMQARLSITGPSRAAGTNEILKTADQLCDEKLVPNTTLTASTLNPALYPTPEGQTPATHTALTDQLVCRAAAALHGLTDTQFIARNGSLTMNGITRTGATFSTVAGCANAVKHGGTNGQYNYDDAKAMTPKAVLPHRIFVSTGTALATASLNIVGVGVGAHADLGILDLDVDVKTLSLNPTATIGFKDPGTGLKADGKIDLWEMARKADEDKLTDLLTFTFAGTVEIRVDVLNTIVMGTTPRKIAVVGNLANLANGLASPPQPVFQFHSNALTDTGSLASNRIHIGHDFAELLNLKNITPAQALQMIVGVLERIAAMGDPAVMGTKIPFIDVTPADMVDFTRTFADIVQRVEQRSPEDITALQSALNEALRSAGMPSDLVVGVTPDELTLRFDASRSVTRTYPFTLDAGSVAGGALSFAPADGGATVSATAGVTFTPTIGIKFAGTGIDDRIFVRDVTPSFEVGINADLFGSVHIGPLLAGIRGNAAVGGAGAELAVVLKQADGATPMTGDITLTQLAGVMSNPGSRIGLTFSGPVSGSLNVNVTIPGVPGSVTGTVTVLGNLNDPTNIQFSKTGFNNFQLKLDLNTFVNGSVAAARFVGRTMQQSEVIATDVPFLGDELRALATAGADLRRAADEIDAFWKTHVDNPDGTEAFRAGLQSKLQTALCTPLIAAGQSCTATIALEGGTTIATATGFSVRLQLGKSGQLNTTLDGGLSLDVFELDADIPLELRYGYGLDVILGVNTTQGFYVKAGDSMGGDLLRIYGGATATVNNLSVSLLGLSANINNGSITIGGGLGNNNGGFAVGIPQSETVLTGGTIGMRDITNRRTKVERIVAPRFDLTINAKLPLTVSATGIADLIVPVHFNMTANGRDKPTPQLFLGCTQAVYAPCAAGGETIRLDAQKFVDQIITPIFKDTLGNPKYNPLGQPDIKKAIDEKIPVLDTTLRALLREAATLGGQQAAWALIEFLIDVGNMNFNASGLGTLNLGYAQILPTFQHVPPRNAQNQIDYGIPPALMNLIENLRRISGAAGFASQSASTSSSGFEAQTAATSAGSLLAFPILDNPGSALKLILGGELAEPVGFVEFRPPPVTIGKSINFSRTLFSLDIGFLKGGLTVALRGDLGLTLHVGFGYDSTGISTGNPLDGFYLIDHAGFEVSLGGGIQGLIDGHFSVAADIVSVRFRGSAGANLRAGLDLFDDAIALPRHSRNNGKMHLWEMGVITNAYKMGSLGPPSPLCIFALGVRFDANLAFSGKARVLGVTVFDKSWKGDWVLVDRRFTCTPVTVPAHIDDNRRLVLNGGTFADFRFDGRGDVTEEFTLSQTATHVGVSLTLRPLAGGTAIETISKSFPLADFDEIYAELGAGDDKAILAAGITKPATLYGGPGNDELQGGGGDDLIDGGAGNDTLRGGPGDDELIGGEGVDTLQGDGGDDILDGGAGTNTYRFANAWGNDTMEDAGANATLEFTGDNPLVGTSLFDQGEVTSTGGTLSYFLDEVTTILGGSGSDHFNINSYAPEGLRINLRGGSDRYTVNFSGNQRTIHIEEASGTSTGDVMEVNGTAADDLFLFRAKGGGTGPATSGFVAMGVQDTTVTGRVALMPGRVDRVNYTNGINSIITNGVGGANRFYLDDAAAPMTVNGGHGGSTFQVGQIYRLGRQVPQVAAGDEVRTRPSFVSDDDAADHLSYGVSHATIINGGSGDDLFTVYSNRAQLNLNGISGDNVFVIRAFVLDGTVKAVGGDGNDVFEYVKNELVEIDGGDGFNTMIVIGTPFSDGFVVDADGFDICPIAEGDASTTDPKQRLPLVGDPRCGIDVTYTRIQRVVLHALHGNDVFWVRSTDPEAHYVLQGGTDGSTFYVHDRTDGLRGVEGPITIDGDNDPAFDASLAAPVVLPGENDTAAMGTIPVVYDRQDNWLVVDASNHTAADVGMMKDCEATFTRACRTGSARITGLGMGAASDGTARDALPIRVGTDRTDIENPVEISASFPTGVTYHAIDRLTVELGSGADTFTVTTTHDSTNHLGTRTVTETLLRTGPGDDNVAVRTIRGPTRVVAPDGQNTVRVSTVAPTTTGGRLTGIAAALTVDAGDDAPATKDGRRIELYLDASGTAASAGDAGDMVKVEPGKVSRLSMGGEVRHANTDLLDIRLTNGKDVANIRGTTAGMTRLRGLQSDDRFFVSDQASYEVEDATPGFLPGALTDLAGALDIVAGGDDNLLMVSDRARAEALTGSMTANGIAFTGYGPITYDATGTFNGGVTVWTGGGADTMSVSGVRKDGDPTTLAWADKTPSTRSVITLNAGADNDSVTVAIGANDGFLAVNLGAGDDTLLGSGSTRGFVAFGGPGADTMTTGTGDDIAFGDEGRLNYGTAPTFATILGDEDDAARNNAVASAPAEIVALAGSGSGADSVTSADGDNVLFGGDGADTITAGPGDDVLFGDRGRVELGTNGRIAKLVTGQGIGADALHAGAGDNRVLGGGAGDTVTAGNGDDVVFGDHGQVLFRQDGTVESLETLTEPMTMLAGPDEVSITGGRNVVFGGEGGDTVTTGAGDDVVLGDMGRVELTAEGVATSITTGFGRSGGDTLNVGAGDNRVLGGGGGDTVTAGSGHDVVFGDHGTAEFSSAGVPETLTTVGEAAGDQAGDDTVTISGGDNFVLAGEGADEVATGAGHDVVLGDRGQVELTAGVVTSINTADGRSGNDVLHVGDGNNRVLGAGADDTVTAGSGNDVVFGDHGTATFTAAGAIDTLETVLETIAGNDTITIAGGNNHGLGGNGHDTISTGDGHDIVFGDLGRVHQGSSTGWPEEVKTRIAGTPGNDTITLGGGNDAALGGLGNDRITAASGRNAIVGDTGHVRRVAATPVAIRSNGGFIDVILQDGVPWVYEIDVFDAEGGGDDVLRGGLDDDVIFGGPGRDVVVGSPGDGTTHSERGDVIFGGDGNDIIWGGPGDDRIYGGNGDNIIDLNKHTFDSGAFTQKVHDAAWWTAAWTVAPVVDTNEFALPHNGNDIVYGGRGRDAIQIDVGTGGPTRGDRMMDFYGPYNLFLTCSGQYGAGSVLRDPAPDTFDTLLALAAADGAHNVADQSSSGWRQLALVTREFANANRNPGHPDNPGNNAPCASGTQPDYEPPPSEKPGGPKPKDPKPPKSSTTETTREFATASGPSFEDGVVRLSGAGRFETAANISAAAFPDGAEVAYVATGLNYPDALAGGAAAAAEGGPVLLTADTSVPVETDAELRRLAPKRIVVLGGAGSVSDAVVQQLQGIAPATRVSGPNRFATAVAISQHAFAPEVDAVYVATGLNYPDALAGGAAAGARGGPMLLVTAEDIPAEVGAELARLKAKRIVVLGGAGAVSAAVMEQLAGHAPTERISGASRFATAAQLAESTFPQADVVYVATGLNYPDALSGSAAAAATRSPMLLVHADVPEEAAAQIRRLNPRTVVVLGGNGAVSEAVADQLRALLR